MSGSDDATIKIWDAITHQLVATLQVDALSVTTVALSLDGSKIVSGGHLGDHDNFMIYVWGAATLRKNGLVDDVGIWSSVSASPDESKIVSGSLDVKIWDAITHQLIGTLEGHTLIIRTLAASPDGSKIVSGSYDETIRIWDVGRYSYFFWWVLGGGRYLAVVLDST